MLGKGKLVLENFGIVGNTLVIKTSGTTFGKKCERKLGWNSEQK
jgi:hypothetical protein